MTEHERIRDQLIRVHRGPAWHGPTVLEVVDGVTLEQASATALPNTHSIGELVLHIAAWRDIVRRRIAGEQFEVRPEEDWPQFDGSAAAWKAALEGLERSHDALLVGLSMLKPARLDEAAVKGGSTCYVQLMGVTQHDTYHAGQIAVLRKRGG